MKMSVFHFVFDKLYPLIRFTYETIQGHNWYDPITDHLWLGGAPTYDRDYAYLLDHGIGAVVDIRNERSDDLELYEREGVTHLKLRVPDMHAPPPDVLTEGVNWMKAQIDQQRVVYVHCAKGRARSASLIVAYLMKHDGMGYEEAKKMLENKRPLVKLEGRHKKNITAWLAAERDNNTSPTQN